MVPVEGMVPVEDIDPPDRDGPAIGRQEGRRSLALTDDGVDHRDVDERVATLWRAARLGPTVEMLRRHVLQGGERTIEAGQFRALDAIAAHGPCALREIVVVMAVEPSTVTRATSRLEAHGLIRKRRADHDHREVVVELTDDGSSLHQYLVDRAFEVYEEIFAGFTADEKVLLADFLERMLKATDVALARAGHADDRRLR
jgi:MarR family transcriptional regulator, organic hydroperoxide resistance regulator